MDGKTVHCIAPFPGKILQSAFKLWWNPIIIIIIMHPEDYKSNLSFRTHQYIDSFEELLLKSLLQDGRVSQSLRC